MNRFKSRLAPTVALIVSLLLFISCKNEAKSKPDVYSDFDKYVSTTIQKMEEENTDRILNNQIVFLGNDSLGAINLTKMISSKKLFFNFSANTCSPCIDRSVDILNEVFPNYEENEEIVFVSPDYPLRFRENGLDKRLLTLEQKFWDINIEKTELPFFMVVNSNLQIESIHVVNKSNFERTRKYLQQVKKVLQKKI